MQTLQNQLIYLFYGKSPKYRQEVKFSILSALANSARTDNFQIHIFTDSPQDFSGWPVKITVLDEATLSEWDGDINYNHRRKACAISTACKMADKTIFVDSDTIFLKNPSELFDRVDANTVLVDEFEWTWQHAVTLPEYNDLSRHLESTDASPAPSLRLYNSGICGLSKDHSHIMDSAIDLIDSWEAFAKDLHTVEQIALSFNISNMKVREARDTVNHYYGERNIFHSMIFLFFSTNGESFSEQLVELAKDVPNVKPKPSIIHRTLIQIKLLAVRRQVRAIIKKVMYGRALPDSPYFDACRDSIIDHQISLLEKLKISDEELDKFNLRRRHHAKNNAA